MRERVVITGMGCVSCFGVGAPALADAILEGASGIAPITAFDTSTCHSHLAATTRDFDPAAFVSPLKLRRVDAAGRLALACAKLAIDDAGYRIESGGTDQLGVALGTFSAGIDSTVEFLKGLSTHGPAGVPAILFSNTVANAPASLCAIEHGLRGPNVTFNQREASSAAALSYAIGAIRDGRVTGMLSGGVDIIEETFFKTHDLFRALSPRRKGGVEGARPFDRDRNGFVLGEGGFVLVLESATSAAARDARVYGELLGVGATSSVTALNGWPTEPSGIVRAMRAALEDAGVQPAAVGLVSAAANGSPVLDAAEAAAIAEVFGAHRVPVTSIKGAIGESGSATAAAVAVGLRTLRDGVVPPTVGFAVADPACAVDVTQRCEKARSPLFLANSIASGGTNVALVVKVLEL